MAITFRFANITSGICLYKDPIQKKMMMKHLFKLLGLSVLLLSAGCSAHKEEKEAETKFLVTSPLKKDTIYTKKYVCQIRAINHIELRTQERGYLQEILVDEGQFVRKGQLLFRIMPRVYQAELQRAEAEARAIEVEYQNTKALADKKVVSPNELAMAKAKLDKARAEQALAQTHLDFTSITAPFDGIIDRFQARLGSLLEEGDLLTTLSDNSKMWVYFNVSESEYLSYREHMEKQAMLNVKLLMANNELFDQIGVVETIEADFDNETGNIPFRATFPNPKKLLRHGETGTILVETPLKKALIIPQKATFEIMDKRYVYVVDNTSTIRLREINVAAELPDLYVISSGLTTGDKILLEGLRKVQDNQKITYEYQKPEQVISRLVLPSE